MHISKITDEDGFTLDQILLDIYDRLQHIEEDISMIAEFITPCRQLLRELDDKVDDEEDEFDQFYLPPPLN